MPDIRWESRGDVVRGIEERRILQKELRLRCRRNVTGVAFRRHSLWLGEAAHRRDDLHLRQVGSGRRRSPPGFRFALSPAVVGGQRVEGFRQVGNALRAVLAHLLDAGQDDQVELVRQRLRRDR